MAKVYTVDEIKNKLSTNDKWLVRGLLAIYAKQTADERAAEVTQHQNGVGFNGTDANILSSFAKQVLQWQATENPRYQVPLSPKQFALLRRKMNKYAAQLVRIAEANNPVEDLTPPARNEYSDQVRAELEAEADAEARAERDAIQGSELVPAGVVEEFSW